MIIPTSEPFLFPGGSTGILLIHGFTGTPKEMRSMGKYFSDRGFSVLGVRLAGHATHPDDMLRVHWQDWMSSVEDGYHLLRGMTNEIVISGLSMGGVLTLLFAAQYKISGLIAMSTPYSLPPDPRMRFLPWLRLIMPRVPKGETDWQDPSPQDDHIDYPYYPTKAILELSALVTEMQAALPGITAPALLMHSRKDGGVEYKNMEKIYNHIGSLEKEMFTIENSGHVIVRDLEKDRVFEAAEKFIQRICGNPE
jgi:carboxylesterase